MKLRTIIIDDEPIALEKLKNYVAKEPELELIEAYQSATDAVASIRSEKPDLIITDIRMPDLNGLELVASLSRPPMIIFTTAYTDYAVESYRLAAVDYILKPYSFADFQRAVGKAVERAAATSRTSSSQSVDIPSTSLFIKVDYRFIRVDLPTIRYIKGFGEYLRIWIEGSASPLVTLSSFNAIIDRLSPNFLQVHRSYIVNMDRVEQINRGRIVMDADTVIPVGDSYKSSLNTYLSEHSVGMATRKTSPDAAMTTSDRP